MARTRVGIIGTGFAATSHIDALRRLPSVEIAAVAGRSATRAAETARRLGVERSHGDPRGVLEDDTIAVVHNCTPNEVHAEINATAMSVGKHVLSEKPLGLDSGETERLMHQAATSDLVTGVCFNYRHYPLVRQTKEMLSSGEHGRAFLVHGGYLQDWLLFEDDWNWRLESDRAGASRAMADIGSHWIDNVQHVLGERVIRVQARIGRLHEQRWRPAGEVETFARSEGSKRERVSVDTEDFGLVLLEFAGGCRGSLTVSQVSAGRKNRLFWEIDTPQAAFAWDQEQPNRLWIGRRDEANRELVRDPSLLDPSAAALAHLPGGHQEGWPEGLKNLLIDFYAAIEAHDSGRDHDASFATFEDAHQVTRVVEAIVASDEANTWLDVGSAKGVRA